MTTPTSQQLDEIEARAAHLYEYGTMPSQDGQNALDQLTDTDVPALLAEVRRLRAELAEYEVLNPQQCPAGKHADWLVDSEYAHACPWCANERLTARVAELEQTLPACGRSWSTNGDEYPPCARPEDHPEAYCRSADGQSYFLAAAEGGSTR